MSSKRFSVCLTFDFDAMSVWVGSAKSNNPSMISRGEFGAIGVDRILALLKRRGLPATFYIPGHTALAFPDRVKAIVDHGHEVGHHGWVHENPADFDEAGERDILEKGFDALMKTGGVRPVGYRSPAWDLSPRSIDLLLEYGLLYDSSCMGHDFSPYFLRKGDQWSTTEPYVFGTPSELVEMPVWWGLDDFPPFEFVFGAMTAMNPPSVVEENWRGEFDWGYANVDGGVFILTMHPQVIGRGSRLTMLERLIDHMAAQPGVVFETMEAVATRWKGTQG